MKLKEAVEKSIISYMRGRVPKAVADQKGEEFRYTPAFLEKLVNGDEKSEKRGKSNGRKA